MRETTIYVGSHISRMCYVTYTWQICVTYVTEICNICVISVCQVSRFRNITRQPFVSRLRQRRVGYCWKAGCHQTLYWIGCTLITLEPCGHLSNLFYDIIIGIYCRHIAENERSEAKLTCHIKVQGNKNVPLTSVYFVYFLMYCSSDTGNSVTKFIVWLKR